MGATPAVPRMIAKLMSGVQARLYPDTTTAEVNVNIDLLDIDLALATYFTTPSLGRRLGATLRAPGADPYFSVQNGNELIFGGSTLTYTNEHPSISEINTRLIIMVSESTGIYFSPTPVELVRLAMVDLSPNITLTAGQTIVVTELKITYTDSAAT